MSGFIPKKGYLFNLWLNITVLTNWRWISGCFAGIRRVFISEYTWHAW